MIPAPRTTGLFCQSSTGTLASSPIPSVRAGPVSMHQDGSQRGWLGYRQHFACLSTPRSAAASRGRGVRQRPCRSGACGSPQIGSARSVAIGKRAERRGVAAHPETALRTCRVAPGKSTPESEEAERRRQGRGGVCAAALSGSQPIGSFGNRHKPPHRVRSAERPRCRRRSST
jgi:hypothetical protein